LFIYNLFGINLGWKSTVMPLTQGCICNPLFYVANHDDEFWR